MLLMLDKHDDLIAVVYVWFCFTTVYPSDTFRHMECVKIELLYVLQFIIQHRIYSLLSLCSLHYKMKSFFLGGIIHTNPRWLLRWKALTERYHKQSIANYRMSRGIILDQCQNDQTINTQWFHLILYYNITVQSLILIYK